MFQPRATDLPTLAFEVVERGDDNAWSVLLVNATALDEVVDRLSEAFRGVAPDQPVQHVRADSTAAVIAGLRQGATSICIVYGFDRWSEDEWRRLDQARSRLEHPRPVLCVCTPETFDHLVRSAPNVFSWIGGSVWSFREAPPISEDEREARVAALREQFGLSDADVIRRAEQRELSPEPEFAEWLLLLGRGDLLEP